MMAFAPLAHCLAGHLKALRTNCCQGYCWPGRTCCWDDCTISAATSCAAASSSNCCTCCCCQLPTTSLLPWTRGCYSEGHQYTLLLLLRLRLQDLLLRPVWPSHLNLPLHCSTAHPEVRLQDASCCHQCPAGIRCLLCEQEKRSGDCRLAAAGAAGAAPTPRCQAALLLLLLLLALMPLEGPWSMPTPR